MLTSSDDIFNESAIARPLAKPCAIYGTFCLSLRMRITSSNDGWDNLKITDDRNKTIGTYCGNQTGKRVLVVPSVALLTFHSNSVM